MTAKYFAILTNQGAARLANAAALGTKLNLTQMAVGDANGTLPTPDPSQTKLINQKRIAPLNLLTVDPANTSQIIAEQIIPENEGGFWIREIGLYDDDGILIAVANCPETYKPQLQEGSGRTQTIRMILIVSSTSAITLKIDPAVVLATRQYVDDKIIEVKGYADDLMKKHVEAANPHKQYPLIANALKEMVDAGLAGDVLKNLGLQTIKPDPVSTKIFSPDLKKFLLVSNTSWGMWNNDTGAAIALPVSQGGTGQTTVDGVKAAFGIDKLQPKGNYVITDASTKQSLSDALSCRYGLEVTDSNNIARVGIYSANNQATITGINGKAIIIPDKAGTMALAGESVSALRLSAPREVTVTTADAWMNFTTSEMVVGIYITPTPGGGAWVLNKVKVATLQAYINGAWVNVTQ